MITAELDPHQIITLNDYPMYSDESLSEYFNKCKLGEEVPFVPVIRKDIVRKYLDDELLKKLEAFEEKNPEAEYFMIDGSHRTTALTLAGCKISIVIYERDEDIDEARQLVPKGLILENGTLDHTLIENCEILNTYFKEKPYFMTVVQKTVKMIKEGKIPNEMAESFNNLHQK